MTLATDSDSIGLEHLQMALANNLHLFPSRRAHTAEGRSQEKRDCLLLNLRGCGVEHVLRTRVYMCVRVSVE
jgi:hypothetical protein